jgi:hypothetical protein
MSPRQSVVLIIAMLLTAPVVLAQNPDLILSQAERDSILANYDYVFPIWGRQAIERGFDIPYPVGININQLYMNQGIDIPRLGLSVQDYPIQEVEFVEFDDADSRVTTVNGRVDLWLFPFLNIYGFGGEGFATTEVKIAEPIEFTSTVDQTGAYYGFGLTTAAGIKRNWLSVDINWSWTDLEKLSEPVRARIIGIRYGRTVRLGGRKRLAFWVGTMHQKLATETGGSISLSEALPSSVGDQLENYQDSDWYQDLRPPQKILVDQFMERILGYDWGATKVNYDLDKKPADPWNLLLGTNFELNKTWHLRLEAGFVGRKQFLANLCYRLPL